MSTRSVRPFWRILFLAGLLSSSCQTVQPINSQVAPVSPADAFYEHRLQVFDELTQMMETYDAGVMELRRTRPESWHETLKRLRLELERAQNLEQVAHVFGRLDLTYPSLHAQVSLPETWSDTTKVARPYVTFASLQSWHRRQLKTRYFVTQTHESLKRSDNHPKIGDEIIAINRMPIADWQRENFLFCKFPLKEQCDVRLWNAFRFEQLAWKRDLPLSYTLQRKAKVWDVSVPYDLVPADSKDPLLGARPKSNICVEKNYYPGFQSIHTSDTACTFTNPRFLRTTLLRIDSFDCDEPGCLLKEVDKFWHAYWRDHARMTDHLIIDLIDNLGGRAVPPWLAVFFEKPFQSVRVKIRLLPEMTTPEKFAAFLWGEKEKENWFRNLGDGIDRTQKYLPTVQCFCPNGDCSDSSSFPVRPHDFRGRVTLLTNQRTISSAANFVRSFKNALGNRVRIIGLPDSGDTTYARATLAVWARPSADLKFITTREPYRPFEQEKPILEQVISIAETLDQRGNVISGKPMVPDVLIPFNGIDMDAWHRLVLAEALK